MLNCNLTVLLLCHQYFMTQLVMILRKNSAATSNNYDPKKPPDYNDALTYRKPKIPDEGYPEPSLVDEPPPPSYDSVH